MNIRALAVLLWIGLVLAGSASAKQSDEELRKLAANAYQAGHIETGHLHLQQVIAQNPSDMAVTLDALAEILKQSRRIDAKLRAEQPNVPFSENPAAEQAARELCALEQVGVVSANHQSLRHAATILIQHHLHHRRLFEARELVDRLAHENSHDLFWRIQQAHVYRRLNSTEAKPLFTRLKEEMDLDHPDPVIRQQWAAFSGEWTAHGHTLPLAIQPLFKGSPLPHMEPDDPDLEWDTVTTRSARIVAPLIDRVAAKALTVPQIVPWRDKSGLTDPVRALDLHLLSQPAADLENLRTTQEQRYELEKYRDNSTDAKILYRFRRYPWSPSAQKNLRKLANRALFAGRSQAAWRSFQDLLDHATDEKTRDASQVGVWTARTQIENPRNTADLLGRDDLTRKLAWLGKPTPAAEICRQLIENHRPSQATGPLSTAETLGEFTQRLVHIPPTSPWKSQVPNEIDLTIAGNNLLVSGRDMLVLFDARNPGKPLWTGFQPPSVRNNKKPDNNHPGFFRPQFSNGQLFTRWGFSSEPPRGIAGIDCANGAILWTDETNASDHRLLNVPLGDPIPSNGLLYYLEWSSANDVTQGRGRRLNLICFDPDLGSTVWRTPIAIAGHESDLTASLERSQPAFAIYGNRVTVHQGAVYSSSNCGLVARSDIRDGRTDWIYHYTPIPPAERSVLNHGSPPLVAGDKVIYMPRDARRVFALDQRTGRLLWENTLVLGVQLVEVVEDLLIVRGRSLVAGLDLNTGKARWYRPAKHVIGRLAVINDSVYLAQLDELHRLDARSGHLAESRPWNLSDEKPQAFALHGRDLFLVTDKPAEAIGRRVNAPLNASLPTGHKPLGLPLSRAWVLPRDNPRISLPPAGSPLKGSAYVFSGGILERIDLSAQGRILWQRFIDGPNPQIHLIDSTLLAIDYSIGRAPGLVNRLIAFDAASGKTLWEHAIDAPVNATLNCGTTQVFHDAVGRVVAVDLRTGTRVWQRNFGNGFQMRLAWDGTRLHIFFVSRLRSASHVVVDPPTGTTLRNSKIAAKTSAEARNARPIEGGYYEVAINPVKARYVRLTALSEINGRGWASMAELQVAGENGNNLPRQGWSATATSSETKARYKTSPQSIIDDDPVTWWHSQWLGSIPPHPHSVIIDMQSEKTITAVRYLPAVIVNNNGMIREYKLHVSNDGQNWGAPVGEGFMVNQTRVDHAYASDKSIVFESRSSPNQPLNIYRYPLDGNPAMLVRRNAHVLYMKEPFFMIHEGDKLVVYRFDDPAYRFELGPHAQLDLSALSLENNHLILGRKSILVADLAQKRFIVAPGDPNQVYNKDGLLMREGDHGLLKIVPQGDKGHAVFRFNLQNGQRTDSPPIERTESFQPVPGIPQFDGLVLLRDNSSVSAWIGSVQ